MGEAYPSDNTLLNLQADAESGVEYIPTGTAPYYLHFRKLLYRLLLATHRANDLRVFDEGGLDIGVKAGKFWLGTTLVDYAGSTGHTLADDKAGIYIYLTADGTLVTDEYDSFPDMATTAHVRLAIVTTAAGDIVSITDCRTGHNCIVPHGAGGVREIIEAHTSDETLPAAESGSVHTNLGATGTVTLTLPAEPLPGTQFTFAVQAAQELRVDPGTATIRDDSGQTADKYKHAAAIGAALTLVADANGDWATIAKNGTWNEEA
ncbi:MAG: hypothetical protein RBS72_04520 [Sedimentisphaerales bacterium]|jgi:hypothetical protein|nr:hypothetical protein [Sedimentisphaerales bacterium]HNY77622.1 hypothetical protein [Sedimentisphaerales bacterium]HOC61955.1 hypothetical protein [Sedimentisphaerales bacterium]HOH63797.1 hypothetical protein [Sedimentisphaerales bacterium]HPY48299.1 hypothetical protein [Sedimentisphaerales bacterium]